MATSQSGEACCVPRRIRLFQPLNQVMAYRVSIRGSLGNVEPTIIDSSLFSFIWKSRIDKVVY